MPPFALLALAIVGEVVATTALKASEGFTKLGPSLVVLIGYGAAFILLAQVLDRIPVGLAYAIWAGGGIVLISVASWLIYGQRPDLAGFVGMLLIVTGVVVINVLSKTSAH